MPISPIFTSPGLPKGEPGLLFLVLTPDKFVAHVQRMNATKPMLPRRPDAELPAECCAKCRFFFPLAPESMLCRRFPPVMTLLAMPANLPRGVLPSAGQPAPVVFINQSVYAATAPDMWCGEFSADVRAHA